MESIRKKEGKLRNNYTYTLDYGKAVLKKHSKKKPNGQGKKVSINIILSLQLGMFLMQKKF